MAENPPRTPATAIPEALTQRRRPHVRLPHGSRALGLKPDLVVLQRPQGDHIFESISTDPNQ